MSIFVFVNRIFRFYNVSSKNTISVKSVHKIPYEYQWETRDFTPKNYINLGESHINKIIPKKFSEISFNQQWETKDMKMKINSKQNQY